MKASGSAFGFAKGKPIERWGRKVSGLRSLKLYDSGTAVIQSFHRTAAVRVFAHASRRGWREVMNAYHQKAVSPPGRGRPRGRARSMAPTLPPEAGGARHIREVRALRAW